MSLFANKKGIVMGIANERSIATAVARSLHGFNAQLGFSYMPDKEEHGRMEQRVKSVVGPLNPLLVAPCDVSNEVSIQRFFSQVEETIGQIDFLVHSIAYAPIDDIRCATIDASSHGFSTAMNISVYSLINIARVARPMMKEGSSILAMTYFGGEKVMPGYNMMGVCKAALDAAVKYLAWDLGCTGIRVNAISAGPLKTLASSAVGGFKSMLEINAAASPLRRNVTHEEVGKSSCYLLSDLASGVTGEVLHVDAGYNVMGLTLHNDGQFK